MSESYLKHIKSIDDECGFYVVLQSGKTEACESFSEAESVAKREYSPVKAGDQRSNLTPEEAWQDLIETSDVTSPAEYPNHALITFEQLRDYMSSASQPTL